MKYLLTLVTFAMAVPPARAQFADLSAINLKSVRSAAAAPAVPVPAPTLIPGGEEKGYSQGSKWFNYVMPAPSVADGSSAVMDFTVDSVDSINYEHYSLGKLYVRFYTAADPANPAKITVSFKPGDTGMNGDIPKTVKKALTFGKDQYGNYHYYADLSSEVRHARLEANGQVFMQELTVTKKLPQGGSVTYTMPAVKLFESVQY